MGAGEEATISCVVSGLTVKLEAAVWLNKDGQNVAEVAGSADLYLVDAGELVDDSQTTTLKVLAAGATGDALYTCAISSAEWTNSVDQYPVILNVFSK